MQSEKVGKLILVVKRTHFVSIHIAFDEILKQFCLIAILAIGDALSWGYLPGNTLNTGCPLLGGCMYLLSIIHVILEAYMLSQSLARGLQN